MLRDIIAMIAIQSPDGMLFGTARKFDGETLQCEVDADILPGTLVEWRMELPGLDETALGKMRIIGVQRLGNSGVRVWSGAIVSVDREDEDVFSVWKKGVDEGSRSFSKTRNQGNYDFLTGQTTSGTTPAERARAMAVQEERRKRRSERARTLAKNAKAWPDPEERTASAAIGQELFRQGLSGSLSSVNPVRSAAHSGASSNASSASVEYSRPRAKVAETLRTHMRRNTPAEEEPSWALPEVVPVIRAQPAAKDPARAPSEAVVEVVADPPSDQRQAFLGSIADAVARVDSRAATEKRGRAKETDPAPLVPPLEPTAPEPAPAKAKRSTAKKASRQAGDDADPPSVEAAPLPNEPAETAAPSEPAENTRTKGKKATVEATVVAPEAPAATVAEPRPVDPVIHADKGMLSVWFVDPAAYRSHVPSLRGGRLELAQDGLGVPGAPVQVYLRVPSGVVLPLSGSVIFSASGATGLRLNLDASSQKLLEMG